LQVRVQVEAFEPRTDGSVVLVARWRIMLHGKGQDVWEMIVENIP